MSEAQEPLDPEVAAIAKQYLEEMLSGTTCPVCHQPITEERQVGRCVYGIPCWHRMYQGTAKAKPEIDTSLLPRTIRP